MRKILIFLLLSVLGVGELCAQTVEAEDGWITNGRVYTLARGEGKIFMSGEFGWAGPAYPSGTVVLNTNLAHDDGYAKTEGYTEDAISDEAGGWYILEHSGAIAHIKADKTKELLPIQITSGNLFATLTKAGNILYIGGGFDQLNGVTRNNIAAFDLTTNTLTNWNPNSNGYVYSIAVSGSTVYVGGNFTTMGGISRLKIAALDATTAAVTAWNANVSTGAGLVSSIIINGSSLYFSGLFSNVGSGSPTRRNFAAVNTTTGALLSLNPRPNDYTYDMILDGNTLYISGQFSQIAGGTRTGLAALDVTTGVLTSFIVTVDGDVRAMAVDGQKLIVGGQFRTINTVTQPIIAVVNKTTGVLEATEDRKMNGYVQVLTMSGGKLLMGGSFGGITGLVTNSGTMALDEETGEGTAWSPAIPPPPVGEYFYSNDLHYHSGRVYYTMNVSDGTAQVGAVNASDGAAIPSFSILVDGHLVDWAFSDNTLYLVGEFTEVNGTPRNGFAAVNATTGALLPWVPSPAPAYTSAGDTRTIYSIAVHNNVFYATGEFTVVDNGVTRTNIAAYNATTGAINPWASPETFSDFGNIRVGEITNSHVYVMGNGALRISTSTALVDPNWAFGTEDYSFISTMAIKGSSVYLGGGFSPGLVHVSITTGELQGWQPEIDDVYDSEGEVMAVEVSDTKLFVGGNFSFNVDGTNRYYFAKFLLGDSNSAPEIQSLVQAFPIQGVATILLTGLISDLDDNLDLSTLQVIENPSSGAPASIEQETLIIDYSNTPFSGRDYVTIGVCDTQGACAEQELEIELIGNVEVYNGISPNGDGKNDVFIVRYIDSLPGAENNQVTIMNRWGDVVFQLSNYNNDDRAFRGLNDSGKELPSGTYYYKIEYGSGRKAETGYLYLKR